VIAQQVRGVAPGLVDGAGDGELTVDQNQVLALALGAVRALDERLSYLEELVGGRKSGAVEGGVVGGGAKEGWCCQQTDS
jgi:hypothetical protein